MPAEPSRDAAGIARRALERREDERPSFVDEECSGDVVLRAEVETLLASASGELPVAAATLGSSDARPLPSDVPSLGATLRDNAATREPSAPTKLARGAPLGRYVVLEWLGGGGMGVVYSAYDPELDRKVAIKLVRPDVTFHGGENQARARLLREAQALARVRHPAVIAVHDVGSFDREVFVAMEYIDGRTLREWLAETARDWREILDMFLQAGRGLAAAHDAGLVHRDFKPENVLVGEDDRPRVVDFGLARAMVTGEDDGAGTDEPIASSIPAPGRALVTVTRTGGLVGTPAYMALEQFAGASADARIDQFSFCVALYEGLYGERPFPGTTVPALIESLRAGKVREPPSANRVPSSLREALLRGLRPNREDRYESMRALLAELGRDRTRTRRRALVGVAAAALAVTAATIASVRHAPSPVCRGAAEKLTGVWDGDRRRAIESAFQKSGKPFVADALRGVERGLDGYASAWVAMQTDACAATNLRHEQSGELLDLRTECLAERRQELASLVNLLARADDRVILKSMQAVAGLPSLEECANAAALKAILRPPSDPAARAGVEAVRKRVADARALYQAARFDDASGILDAPIADAKALGYAPLEAEALGMLAAVQTAHGKLKEGERAAKEALYLAEQSGHQELIARQWVVLVSNLRQQARYDDVHDCAQHARAAIARWGKGSDETLARLLDQEGLMLTEQGKFDQARELHEQALAIAEKAVPPDTHAPIILSNLGIALMRLGKYDEAMSVYRRSFELMVTYFGPAHPDLTFPLGNMSTVLALQNRPAEAVVYDEQVVQLTEASFGPDNLRLGLDLSNLCSTHIQLHAGKRALGECQRALAIYEKGLGPKHPRVAFPLMGIGEAHLDLEQPKSAVAPLERAVGLLEANPGDPMNLAEARFGLARALRGAGGDEKRARDLAVKARAAYASNGTLNLVDLEKVDAWLGAKGK
jgi:tetratricopeptide (TPR) repeat protein/predicted Ser/Thr protein kinase